jgi:hypothetical protein
MEKVRDVVRMRADWAEQGAEMNGIDEATDEEVWLKASDIKGCDFLDTLCTDEDEYNEEYNYTRLELLDGRIVSVLTFDLDWGEE